MTTPNARVELQAFGGAKGDKGSDARRLSLKRALEDVCVAIQAPGIGESMRDLKVDPVEIQYAYAAPPLCRTGLSEW